MYCRHTKTALTISGAVRVVSGRAGETARGVAATASPVENVALVLDEATDVWVLKLALGWKKKINKSNEWIRIKIKELNGNN